jgi:hypothetical protein
MSYRILIIVFFILFISSCKHDRNGRLIPDLDQRVHDDSVKQRAEQDMKFKLETTYSLRDSIAGIELEISSIRLKLIDKETELAAQNEKMANITEFQLFRSKSKREEQITNQQKIISKVEDDLNKLNDVKMNLEIRVDDYKTQILRTREE